MFENSVIPLEDNVDLLGVTVDKILYCMFQVFRNKKKKKKTTKHEPRGLWKEDLVDVPHDIVITNDYYQRKLIFVNTKNQQNGKVYEKLLNELKSRAESKGSSVPFTVAQVRTKFKKCISECKKAALTISAATGVKRFQDDKDYGGWFDRLFELVKTRDSYVCSERHGDLVVGGLDSASGIPCSSLGWVIVLCSWARHFTVTVHLSTQENKWAPANCQSNSGLKIIEHTTCDEESASHSGLRRQG